MTADMLRQAASQPARALVRFEGIAMYRTACKGAEDARERTSRHENGDRGAERASAAFKEEVNGGNETDEEAACEGHGLPPDCDPAIGTSWDTPAGSDEDRLARRQDAELARELLLGSPSV